jgi:hypothetical protein
MLCWWDAKRELLEHINRVVSSPFENLSEYLSYKDPSFFCLSCCTVGETRHAAGSVPPL